MSLSKLIAGVICAASVLAGPYTLIHQPNAGPYLGRYPNVYLIYYGGGVVAPSTAWTDTASQLVIQTVASHLKDLPVNTVSSLFPVGPSSIIRGVVPSAPTVVSVPYSNTYGSGNTLTFGTGTQGLAGATLTSIGVTPGNDAIGGANTLVFILPGPGITVTGVGSACAATEFDAQIPGIAVVFDQQSGSSQSCAISNHVSGTSVSDSYVYAVVFEYLNAVMGHNWTQISIGPCEICNLKFGATSTAPGGYCVDSPPGTCLYNTTVVDNGNTLYYLVPTIYGQMPPGSTSLATDPCMNYFGVVNSYTTQTPATKQPIPSTSLNLGSK